MGHFTRPGSNAALSAAAPQTALGKLALKGAELFANFKADKAGAIAVETAIIMPFLLFGLLKGGTLAFSIYNHQKVHTAAYSGASYLQDQIAAGDLSGLQGETDENGEKQPGEWIATAKLVIKDASGLPLDLEKIDIGTHCACPAVSPAGGEDGGAADELANRTTFYVRTQVVETGDDDICPTACTDGNKSRIIAEIIIDYDANSLSGGKDTISEKLVTRLR